MAGLRQPPGKCVIAGIGFLAATIAYCIVFFGVGTALYGGLDENSLAHIGAPARRFYFGTIGFLILASYVSMFFAFRTAAATVRRSATPSPRWLLVVLSSFGYLSIVAFALYQIVILLVLSSPGWVDRST